MTTYHFYPMTNDHAYTISKWKYEEPYSLYGMDGSDEDISELLNDEYYSVINHENSLVGFICKGNSARVSGGYGASIYNDSTIVDIGIGLDPDLTGGGRGQEILVAGIRFLNEVYQVNDVQLVVAEFNARAIKVYERIGFTRGINFKSNVSGQEMNFIVMNYSISKG